MFFSKIAFSIQNIGNNALGSENIYQIFLPKPVSFHEMPNYINRSRFGYRMMLGLIFLH